MKKYKNTIALALTVCMVLIGLAALKTPGAKADEIAVEWKKEGGNWYLLNRETQEVLTGIWTVDGDAYYLAEDGKMITGWYKDPDGYYYYLSPADGKMKTGWLHYSDHYYYLSPETGKMHTGWLDYNGGRYYLDPEDGRMAVGWKSIDGTWYRFDEEGKIKTGWEKIDGSWYLMDANGAMLTGWQAVDKKWYYLNEDGIMQKDPLTINGTVYEFDKDGTYTGGMGVCSLAESIPDAAFRNALVAFDTDGSGFLDPVEIMSVREMTATGLGITSLSGMEYLTELTTLDVSDNHLTELDLSLNFDLKYVYAGGNDLLAIDLTGCETLEVLDVSENELTTLQLQDCVGLTALDCSDNGLESLAVPSPCLKALNCSGNRMTGFELSEGAPLEYLDCSQNQMTSLPLVPSERLMTLDCSGNAIAMLDSSDFPELTMLLCADNALSELDFSSNGKLNALDCSGNGITALDISVTALDFSAMWAADTETFFAAGNQGEKIRVTMTEEQKSEWLSDENANLREQDYNSEVRAVLPGEKDLFGDLTIILVLGIVLGGLALIVPGVILIIVFSGKKARAKKKNSFPSGNSDSAADEDSIQWEDD